MIIQDVYPRCKSSKYKKNGHIHNGKQNHPDDDAILTPHDQLPEDIWRRHSVALHKVLVTGII